MNSEQPNWPVLSGLRFALAAVVFNEHMRLVEGTRTFSVVFIGGAVAAFFVISGFSMAHSLSRGSKGFYERRFYRIWPLYILALALALVPMLRGEGVYVWPDGRLAEMPDQKMLILNALMLQPLLTVPLATNLVAWSLGVEAAFYLVVPFYARLSDRIRMAVLIAGIAFAFYAGFSHFSLEARGGFWPYFGMFWLFALGFELFRRRSAIWMQQASLVTPMLVGLGTITMGLSLLVILHQSKIDIAPKWQKVLLYLGELSYPLYILHDPVMAIFNQAAPKAPTVTYYFVCLMAAAVAYHVIDAPLRRWHRSRQNNA